ncbi:MAG TPA: hypothetical protein ENN53_05190 [Candidatus Acetothermia bacterium]|nr:hypothetical protein [Candidatus Acetothermia bacterium]
MQGDKLVIGDEHRWAAGELVPMVLQALTYKGAPLVVTVAGESGAGKSEVAFELARRLEAQGFRTIVIQQDDYFFYPPLTNARLRRVSLDHVGVSEVNLEALDATVREIRGGSPRVVKPLVIYEEDRITQEELDAAGVQVVIVEGTYTTLLPSAGLRILLERPYHELQLARRQRGREAQDEHLEAVLAIEHRIIAGHRERADVAVDLSSRSVERLCSFRAKLPPGLEAGEPARG